MAIDKTKNTRIEAIIPIELKDKLLELAKKNNTSASKIIKHLITEYVDKK